MNGSVRAIKIPLMNTSGQKLTPKNKNKHSTAATTERGSSVLQEIARFVQKKYKILPDWKGDLSDLFDVLKTRSESKCMAELLKLAKKKSSSSPPSTVVGKEATLTTSKRSPIFKRKTLKRRSKSVEVSTKKKEEPIAETTITEVAQRSK